MPSFPHEALVRMFRNSTRLAPGLLRQLEIEVPAYSDVRYDSSDLTDLNPAEYRADLVMVLVEQKDPALGIIVEVQLSVDEEKRYSWPAYIANLRARIRCPVCLLVIATEFTVARWAARTIELGGGSKIIPCVAGPRDVPLVTDLQHAKDDVELAVLSAQMHARDSDIRLVERSVEIAIRASKTLDAGRSNLYVHVILNSLPEAVREQLKMNAVVSECMSDFARRYVEEGKVKGKAEGLAEGRAEGRADFALTTLRERFGPLSDAAQAIVRHMCSVGGDSAAAVIAASTTLQEVLKAGADLLAEARQSVPSSTSAPAPPAPHSPRHSSPAR